MVLFGMDKVTDVLLNIILKLFIVLFTPVWWVFKSLNKLIIDVVKNVYKRIVVFLGGVVVITVGYFLLHTVKIWTWCV